MFNGLDLLGYFSLLFIWSLLLWKFFERKDAEKRDGVAELIETRILSAEKNSAKEIAGLEDAARYDLCRSWQPVGKPISHRRDRLPQDCEVVGLAPEPTRTRMQRRSGCSQEIRGVTWPRQLHGQRGSQAPKGQRPSMLVPADSALSRRRITGDRQCR